LDCKEDLFSSLVFPDSAGKFLELHPLGRWLVCEAPQTCRRVLQEVAFDNHLLLRRMILPSSSFVSPL
jgi:hypothetical protein